MYNTAAWTQLLYGKKHWHMADSAEILPIFPARINVLYTMHSARTKRLCSEYCKNRFSKLRTLL